MIQIHEQGAVRVLTLDRGTANALDAAFLHSLADAFAAADRDGVRGVVLTAQGKIFCAGLDLLALEQADRAAILDLLAALGAALRVIFSCGRPVVAAINGHAVAGGALLALACDLRLMAEGPSRIGLTEVKLGVSVPASALELLRHALERRALETVVYGGEMHSTSDALALGVIDRIVEADQLVVQAVQCIEQWTSNPAAFSDIKARLHAPALAAMDRARTQEAGFVDLWFGEPARSRIAAAAAQLRSRSS